MGVPIISAREAVADLDCCFVRPDIAFFIDGLDCSKRDACMDENISLGCFEVGFASGDEVS